MQSTALAGPNARMHKGMRKQRFRCLRLCTQLVSAGWQSKRRMHTHRHEPLGPGLGVFGSCGKHGFVPRWRTLHILPRWRAHTYIAVFALGRCCTPSGLSRLCPRILDSIARLSRLRARPVLSLAHPRCRNIASLAITALAGSPQSSARHARMDDVVGGRQMRR